LTAPIEGLERSQAFQPFPAGRYRSSTIPALQKPKATKLLGVHCGTQVNDLGNDGANAVLEVSAAGGSAYGGNVSCQVTGAWVNAPGLDQPVERIAFMNGTPRQRQVFHADGLGSIAALTDESGATVQTYAYEAFGSIRTRTCTDLNRVTFTAREALGDSLELYYYRNRVLDPTTGRFTSEDPLGFVDGPNRYVYCADSPINYMDPNGLFWRELGRGLVGAGAGAVFGAASGTAVGAGIGAAVGAFAGGVGAAPGAIAGAGSGLIAGSVGGAISGFVSGALQADAASAVGAGALSGVLTGATGGAGAVGGVVAGVAVGAGTGAFGAYLGTRDSGAALTGGIVGGLFGGISGISGLSGTGVVWMDDIFSGIAGADGELIGFGLVGFANFFADPCGK
jgi:RHS repeat-associated protein